ncbi:MAG: ParB/RepB/Spo0J family partition protein [Allorhizobium sp.]
MDTESILIQDIRCGERLRAVDPARVSSLVASIAEIGLRTPITVTLGHDENGEVFYRLVAGAHRMQAVSAGGAEYIDAFVMDGDEDDAALWEIDENFARAELTDAQRAEHHVRREEILVRKGLVSAPGRGGKRQVGDRSYAAQAADTLGQSQRAVERDMRRGKNITPEVMAEVAGTALDKGVVLDELASTPRDQQTAKLSEIASRGLVSRVRTADDPLNDLEATERQLAALMAAWNRAGADARRKFMDRVDTPVFDRGAA